MRTHSNTKKVDMNHNTPVQAVANSAQVDSSSAQVSSDPAQAASSSATTYAKSHPAQLEMQELPTETSATATSHKDNRRERR